MFTLSDAVYKTSLTTGQNYLFYLRKGVFASSP